MIIIFDNTTGNNKNYDNDDANEGNDEKQYSNSHNFGKKQQPYWK